MHRLLLLGLSGLACAGTPAWAAEPAGVYPAAQVLTAAREACSDLSSPKAAAARVTASGWTKAADPYATPVGALVRFGYDAGRKLVNGKGGKLNGEPQVFARTVAGEALHLVLSHVEMDGVAVLGCRTYDVGEQRRIDQSTATAWAGRKPDQVVERAELAKYTWEPGLQQGQDSLEIFYVPAGSPLVAMTKFPGIAIKADQVSVLR